MAERNNLKAIIEGRIDKLNKSEKITKAELAAISRELLMYVPDTQDVGMVNRLLHVLTPMNRKTAVLFFKAFLPWQEKDGEFTKMFKGDDRRRNRLADINRFLSDEDNTIWTWAAENVEMQAKPKNYATKITKLVERSLNDEAEGIHQADVIKAVLAGGVSVNDVLELVEAMMADVQEDQKDAA